MNRKLTLLAVVAVVAALTSLGSVATASAPPCDVTVTSPASIQTAVDGATDVNVDGLRVVCLDDSGGVFAQQVVFSSSNSGVALRPMVLQAAPDASPVLDGTTLQGTATTVDAIRLTDGVNGLTIQGLEIKEYKGDQSGSDRSSAISAFGAFKTSNVTIRDNNMHDFTWNAVLVGSEGDFIHDDWTVEDNIVKNAGFVGIEFTNVAARSNETSHIEDNTVEDSGFHGILVQARNSIGSSVSPVVRDIEVEENEVSGTETSAGIRLLSFQGLTGPPFSSVGGTARITAVEVKENDVHDNSNDGIRLQAFNPGTTVDDIEVEENTVTDNGGDGIRLVNADDSEIEENTATGNTGTDITQDGASTGNEFEDNTCDSSSGAPIDCP